MRPAARLVLLVVGLTTLPLPFSARAHEHGGGSSGPDHVGAHEHAAMEPIDGNALGVVHFENSGSAAAQAPFIRGIKLLHSFEYPAARLAFQEAGRLDPAFALAAWGEALTYNHTLWNEQDTVAARGALARLGTSPEARIARGRTPRERDYLASVERLYGSGDKAARNAAYCEALEAMVARYPQDLDARAFHALALLGLTTARDHANYMRAAAEAEIVYDAEKRHPGALHYMIHAYDDPVHAPLGLRAARRYALVAPDAPHARHMTAHIFFALGLWKEAIAANDASLRVARERGDPNYHALLWLVYADLQDDRRAAAAELVRSVAADVANAPDKENRLRLAFARATWLVETRGAPGTEADRPVDSTGVTSIGYFAMHDFARGITAALAGDAIRARAALEQLQARIAAAHEQPPGENSAWVDVTAPNELPEAQVLATALEGCVAFADGQHAAGIAKVREAIERTSGWEFEYGPPWSVKPLDELLGELLLADGQSARAAEAFQRTLVSYPNRRLALEGLAAARGAH